MDNYREIKPGGQDHAIVAEMEWAEVPGLGEETYRTEWDDVRQFVAVLRDPRDHWRLFEVAGTYTRIYLGHYPDLEVAKAQAAGTVLAGRAGA